MTTFEKSLKTLLILFEAFTSPKAQDLYAGLLTVAGLVIVAELVLGMFGR
jgi:hypothetical protein